MKTDKTHQNERRRKITHKVLKPLHRTIPKSLLELQCLVSLFSGASKARQDYLIKRLI